MSWAHRVHADDQNGIDTFDSVDITGTTQTGTLTWPGACTVINWAALIAFKTDGTGGQYIQGKGNASPFVSGTFNTWTIAFDANTTPGNSIIVDLTWNVSFALSGCSVTDNQGNTYKPVFGRHPSGSTTFVACFVCDACAGGPCTITISQSVGQTFFQSISVAAQEYGGLVGGEPTGTPPLNFGNYVDATGMCDGATGDGAASSNVQSLSLTPTQANDMLHFIAASLPYCAGVVASDGGTLPPIPPYANTPTQPFYANLAPPPLTTPIADVSADSRQGTPFLSQGLPSGDLFPAWASWFNAVYQFLLSLGAAGGAGSLGAVVIKANYTVTLNDAKRILALASAVPATVTLPNPPPNGTFNIFLQNLGAAAWTIDPNGLMLNNATASLVLTQGQGVYLSTNGVNYFYEGSLAAGTVRSYTQTFAAVSTVTVAHALATTSVQVAVYINDGTGTIVLLVPGSVVVTDANTVTIDFGVSSTGYVVVMG